MIKRKIFAANKGEGKTEWLCDRLNEALEDGRAAVFVGTKKSFYNFQRVYTNKYGHMPRIIQHTMFVTYENIKLAAFTDNYWEDKCYAPSFYRQYNASIHDVEWYMTMDAEDFVK